MERWSEQASQRLRDGEEIAEVISVGENGVVVTNQRVLSFTPVGDGANYRAIERPNIEGVELASNGNADWLGYMAKGGLAGLVGVGIGYTMDFGGLISVDRINPEAAGKTGTASIIQMLGSISRLLAMVDDVLLVGGLLAFALCLGAFGLYLESRTHGLWIAVAGEDGHHVPAPKGSRTAVRRLQRVLGTQPDPATVYRDDPLEPQPE